MLPRISHYVGSGRAINVIYLRGAIISMKIVVDMITRRARWESVEDIYIYRILRGVCSKRPPLLAFTTTRPWRRLYSAVVAHGARSLTSHHTSLLSSIIIIVFLARRGMCKRLPTGRYFRAYNGRRLKHGETATHNLGHHATRASVHTYTRAFVIP